MRQSIQLIIVENNRLIYKQLTENYDSKRINKSGRNYLEYTIRGKVFCKKGKEEYKKCMRLKKYC